MVTQTMNDIMTDNEKQMAKRAGRYYLKLMKTMGVLLLAGLILSGVAVASSDPVGTELRLEAGESQDLWKFYAQTGDEIQYGFGIIAENGSDYRYELDSTDSSYDPDAEYAQYVDEDDYNDHRHHVDGPVELYEYMQTMPWYLQLDLYYAESLDFENATLVNSVSGDVNLVNFDIYETGFYRLRITNMANSTFDVAVGQSQANIPLIATALGVWVAFGLTVALFTASVHIGWWILVFYVIIKALKIIADDNNKGGQMPQQATVIGPREQA